jgi:CreA protein
MRLMHRLAQPRVAAGLVMWLGWHGAACAADGSRIGEVSTTFRLLGRNDRIAVDRYDDPKVDGVSCYLSHAETGGVAGSFGLATDPSRFSLTCRATGKVTPKGDLPDNEVVFGERTSIFFKELRVTRIVDRSKRVLVYVAWSTKTLSTGGSPYNAIAAVPLDPP